MTKESSKKRGAPKKAEAEKKDRVLQTRVPESMYEDLVAKARRLRVPVSNLVRNIIEDSFRIVENLVDGGLDIAEAIGGRVSADELAQVVGWQPMVANREVPCAHCGRNIDKDAEAFTSVGAPGGRTFVVCGGCRKKV